MRDYSRYHFREIKGKEKVVFVIHRHWFDILRQFFGLIFFVLILTGGFFLSPALTDLFSGPENYKLFVFMENILLIMAFLYASFIWIDYYFDVWVVTDKHIVNIEQKELFNRHVSELRIERIQDVTVEVTGLLSTLLNFGDIYIQTAGEKERFIFRMVPNPYSIKDLIMRIQRQVEKEESNELGEVIREQVNRNNE